MRPDEEEEQGDDGLEDPTADAAEGGTEGGLLGAIGHLAEAFGHFASESDGGRRRRFSARPSGAARPALGGGAAKAAGRRKGCGKCKGIRFSLLKSPSGPGVGAPSAPVPPVRKGGG